MEELSEKRLSICKSCPLYKEDKFYGPVCDNSKYMNPKTEEVSYFKKEGWIRGCSCKLKYKTLNPNAKCNAGRW